MIDGVLKGCKYIRYTYDFGDDWRHKIVFEKEDPDYKARYAMVLKYKGDSFEEDSGGAVRDENEDFRVGFDIEIINKKLSKMHLPVQRETKASKELLDEIRWQDKMKKLNKTIRNNFLKEIQKIVEMPQLSGLAKKVRQWTYYYEKNSMSWNGKFMKNASQRSCVELLWELDFKGGQEYCKYIGANAKEAKDVMQCAKLFWEELEKHPEYLAYIFDPAELQELMQLIQAPNGILNELPDQVVVEKAIALGFFDLSEERVNRNQYVVLSQAAAAKKLIGRYSLAEWKHIGNKCQQRLEKTNHLINFYNLMELDAFCKKYQEYYEPFVSKEEILRCIYLAGTFIRSLQTAETREGTAYIAEYYIDMNKVIDKQRAIGVEEEYRSFSPKERKAVLDGYGELYPVWSEYYEYVSATYGLDDEETEDYLHKDYFRVKNGEGAETLWENAQAARMLQSIE